MFWYNMNQRVKLTKCGYITAFKKKLIIET